MRVRVVLMLSGCCRLFTVSLRWPALSRSLYLLLPISLCCAFGAFVSAQKNRHPSSFPLPSPCLLFRFGSCCCSCCWLAMCVCDCLFVCLCALSLHLTTKQFPTHHALNLIFVATLYFGSNHRPPLPRPPVASAILRMPCA